MRTARSFVPSGPKHVKGVVLDITGADFAGRLRTFAPDLVIHCVGPFQGRDYRIPTAALDAGAHYLDLADGREFVAQFALQMHEEGHRGGPRGDRGRKHLARILIGGCAGAAARALILGSSIQVVIAPGQRAPRGRATLQAVFSYLGKAFPVPAQGEVDSLLGVDGPSRN